jgi:hypothetical protein
MSLGIVVKGTEGVVLAADSRVSVHAERETQSGESIEFDVDFDNTNKLLRFSEPQHQHVGVLTFGQALIGRRTAHSFRPEIEEKHLPEERASVREYAETLQKFYQDQWDERVGVPEEGLRGASMSFIVAGYDEGEPYGRVFLFSIPSKNPPEEANVEEFGMSWGGQTEIVTRLVKGFDDALPIALKNETELDEKGVAEFLQTFAEQSQYSIPYEVLPLQDCINLAILMIRTTIDVQSLAIGPRGVGGRIEAATITREDGLQFIQQKELHGESHLRGGHHE